MPKPIPMTADDLARLRAELDNLKTEGRAKIRADLAHARSFGDLSENAEYDEAKRAHSTLEGRIAQLEEMLSRAQVVDACDAGAVSVGARVTVLDIDAGEELLLSIGLNGLADAGAILVTPDSPMGRALMGKCTGDTVEVSTPRGPHKLQITAIDF